MTTPPDDLVLACRALSLATRWAGRPLVHLARTSSTNDDARAAARDGAPQGYTVVADAQSAGRGRRGRAWHSPVGANVYASVLLRPAIEVHDAPLLALVAGLAVARACDRFVPPAYVTVKWPNDVRIHRKKAAGILVEGAIREGGFDSVIVGVGLNVHPSEWPPELVERATSLGEHCATVTRAAALGALLEELERAVDEMLSGPSGRSAVARAVAERCDTLASRVQIEGVEGIAEAIEDDGALRVRRDDGSVTVVRSGEVS